MWSNASAVVVPEGWCVVLWRDQLWQQSRDEVELRQTWQEGATEDYLLLCNPSPGSRYYSLESEFGGRPQDWWNDQAKAIWVFPDPKVASCRQGTIVLYENDEEPYSWELSIRTDGEVSFTRQRSQRLGRSGSGVFSAATTEHASAQTSASRIAVATNSNQFQTSREKPLAEIFAKVWCSDLKRSILLNGRGNGIVISSGS